MAGVAMGGTHDGDFRFLQRGAVPCFGHDGALLGFHAITEDTDQRLAHERDGDMRLDPFRFPVVDRPDLQVVLGHTKRECQDLRV